jgi:hypothetical protein
MSGKAFSIEIESTDFNEATYIIYQE